MISASRRGEFRWPPVQNFQDVADHPAHIFDRGVCAGGHVGREQDVVEAKQGIVGLGGFRVEHVNGGARDIFRADRAGTFPFYCALTNEAGHKMMRGELVVRAK